MNQNVASERFEYTEQKVESNNVDTNTVIPAPTAAPDVLIYVQLRARWAAKGKAMAALETLAAKHAGVEFTVAGVSQDARYLNITLAVNAGPVTQIAKNSNDGNATAQAAYLFVSALFTQMFDYFPQYTTEPTTEQQAAAIALLAAAPVTPAAAAAVVPAPRAEVTLDAAAAARAMDAEFLAGAGAH